MDDWEFEMPDVIPLVRYTEEGEPVWRTKEGDEVPITKMSNAHVQNAHRYIKEHLDFFDNDWLYIFWQELRIRGITPLPTRR